MKKVVFHVGLHRTGTTFLQRKVFPKIKEIELFGQGNKRWNPEAKLSDKKINLISDENLSFGGASFREHAKYSPKRKRTEKAELIKKLYPNAKIIITVRNKDEWIKSMYGEYIKKGGSKTFDYWYKNVLKKETLEFEEYISLLKQLFEEVLVCHFEDFKNNHEFFIKEICDFIGVGIPSYDTNPVGVRLTDRKIKLLRVYNKIFKTRYSHEGVIPEWLNPLGWFYKLDK